jgi:16S rRNA (uracil1498-N3)-methyltransferase
MAHRFLFYLNPAEIRGDEVCFDRWESHHLSGVLRHGAGAEIEATDGRGNLYTVRLERKHGGLWHGVVFERISDGSQKALPLALALPCLKGDRWELILEAACELGAAEIWLVDYEQAAAQWLKSRVERARRKAVEALKQSGGHHLTQVMDPCGPEKLVDANSNKYVYLADACGEAQIRMQEPALVVIGPEAGFSNDEEALFRQTGALTFRMGSRRLRSEIAGIAALTLAALHLAP